MRIWWLQGPPKGTPDPRNGSNASPGMCPDLFHPCSTLFHQFGATRLAYGPKRPFLAVLDPVWPYNWLKWLEQQWSLVEQVNPYQNEAKNIIGCHGKPTLKKPPSLTHCAAPSWAAGEMLIIQQFSELEEEDGTWRTSRANVLEDSRVGGHAQPLP